MEFGGSYNRDREVQRGFGDDGRAATGNGLHTPSTNPLLLDGSKENGEAGLWTPPSIPRLQYKRNAAIQAFVTLNKNFDIKNCGLGLPTRSRLWRQEMWWMRRLKICVCPMENLLR